MKSEEEIRKTREDYIGKLLNDKLKVTDKESMFRHFRFQIVIHTLNWVLDIQPPPRKDDLPIKYPY